MVRSDNAGMNLTTGFAWSCITSSAAWRFPQHSSPLFAIGLLMTAILVAGTSSASGAGVTRSPIHSIGIVLNADAEGPRRTAASRTCLKPAEDFEFHSDRDRYHGQARKPGDDLYIHLGVAQARGAFHDLCAANSIRPPGKVTPNPEGFAIKTIQDGKDAVVVAVGADDRGVLYAVGEIVRRMQFEADFVEFPQVDVSTSPAFRFRGFSANQGGTMITATKARQWTTDERQDVMLDYALAGGNTFYVEDSPGPTYQFVKSYSLMTTTGARPNQLLGKHPKEWTAGGRQAWEGNEAGFARRFQKRLRPPSTWAHSGRRILQPRGDHDVMRFFAGDPGGCTDERCQPWGKTFVGLCEEMAAVWHKYHPNSIVMIANQGLDNAGDQAIFDYYRQQPRPWSYGITYGPGSNADIAILPREGASGRPIRLSGQRARQSLCR